MVLEICTADSFGEWKKLDVNKTATKDDDMHDDVHVSRKNIFEVTRVQKKVRSYKEFLECNMCQQSGDFYSCGYYRDDDLS